MSNAAKYSTVQHGASFLSPPRPRPRCSQHGSSSSFVPLRPSPTKGCGTKPRTTAAPVRATQAVARRSCRHHPVSVLCWRPNQCHSTIRTDMSQHRQSPPVHLVKVRSEGRRYSVNTEVGEATEDACNWLDPCVVLQMHLSWRWRRGAVVKLVDRPPVGTSIVYGPTTTIQVLLSRPVLAQCSSAQAS